MSTAHASQYVLKIDQEQPNIPFSVSSDVELETAESALSTSAIDVGPEPLPTASEFPNYHTQHSHGLGPAVNAAISSSSGTNIDATIPDKNKYENLNTQLVF